MNHESNDQNLDRELREMVEKIQQLPSNSEERRKLLNQLGSSGESMSS